MNQPDQLPALPEPDLHVHELLRNDGGVWLGCKELDVVKRAHDPGETGDEIKALFTTGQMRSYALTAIKAERARADALQDLPARLRLICRHDSWSVDGCVTCEAADRIEGLKR